MDLALKYRIVGAIVLVSLAVIFVPIVLDGSGQNSANGSGYSQINPIDSDIPPEPALIFIDEQPTAAADSESLVAASKRVGVDADDLSHGIHPEVSLAKGGSSKLLSWVVQVGAFSQRDKALALKKQLACEELDLFIEVAGDQKKRVYRVKIGPMLSRDKALKIQAQLADKFQLTAAFVSSYPRIEP